MQVDQERQGGKYVRLYRSVLPWDIAGTRTDMPTHAAANNNKSTPRSEAVHPTGIRDWAAHTPHERGGWWGLCNGGDGAGPH